MSMYGPAFFVKRKDKQEISEQEQQMLLQHITAASKQLGLKDEDSDAVEPAFYDYDGYEDKSAAYLIYASFAWAMMPEEVQQEQAKEDAEGVLKIGKTLDELYPDTYEYQCYYVES